MDSRECPFCAIDPERDPDRVAFADPGGHGIWDAFPVSRGHLLVVPRRHAPTFNDLTDAEKAWVWSTLDRAIALVTARHAPDGFNVGFNLGAAAGQTVPHFHLHVIPRHAGDVPDPRGGVRHVVPGKGNYLAGAGDDPAGRRLVTGGGVDPLLPRLVQHLDRADRCDIAVAFLLDSGARLLVDHLADFLDRGGTARILVSDYLDVTDPAALRRLADLGHANLALKVYETRTKGFHLKSYAFVNRSAGVAFVGSSNLSEPALTTTLEWNYKVVSADGRGFEEIRDGFEALFADPAARVVDADWIEGYQQRRRETPPAADAGVVPEPPQPVPQPHDIQAEALAALAATRQDGYGAGLVVLATGLGKTWLAAFDSQAFSRVLFVCHRDEILTQAIATFRRIRPQARIGRLAGSRRETDADLLFASIQTLARADHLRRFRPDAFDYIVVDEFHHAAAHTYRRVIDHFTPRFLLGLTATPDRSDGGDLLTLCQENVVFEANIRDGIERGRLCAFRYFGVPDEVDYTNIPWRGTRFDDAALTAALNSRARNALEQYRKHGGKRCIAFCCSQAHADFMAAFFQAENIAAVAVHSGPGSAARATSLQRLKDGDLEVIFAVDMFNEGVDVPALDTVLMLRPTESTIIWLQQLGRGLRVSPDKDHLTVIDYIGNHRVFVMKLRAMAAMLDGDTQAADDPRALLEAIVGDRLTLPAGCAVTYETEAIDILRTLLERRPNVVEQFYRDFEASHGVRPTATAVFHAGLGPANNPDRSWLGLVRRMGGLSDPESAALAGAREFFARLERTPMTRSYKMVLLLAMLDGDSLARSMTIDALAQRVAATVRRIHGLVPDFPDGLDDTGALARLLRDNPIAAFVTGRGMGGVPYFTFDRDTGTFSFAFAIPDPAAFAALLREIIDWRLAQYLSRGMDRDVVCRVSRNQGGNPILFLPNGGTGGLPKGDLDIVVDGRPMVATVARIAVNVVRAPDATANELPAILRGWFGGDAGRPGRTDRVRFQRTADGVVMAPFLPDATADAALSAGP